MRDLLMSEQYFQEFIAEEEARVNRFVSKLEKGEIRSDRVLSVERRIQSIQFGIFIAKYSVGVDLDELKVEFDGIVDSFPRFWTQTSSYINLVWMMSIAIMFDIEDTKFTKLADLMNKYDRHDALLDFFTDYKLNGVVELKNHHFSCPVPYAELGRIIEASENLTRSDLLRTYLEKEWYPGHKQFGICDVHESKERLYSGYWSFESGALAKILDIDDNVLKNIQYYPYDLAHYSERI